MAEFFAEHLLEIIFALISAGALAFCKYLHSQLKSHKALLQEKRDELIEELIESKVEPIKEEIENLRQTFYKYQEEEQNVLKLLRDSYRFRLMQLCRLYLKQGYMTQSQYDQITEMYKLYHGLGGNGQAQEYYEKIMKLDIKDNSEK